MKLEPTKEVPQSVHYLYQLYFQPKTTSYEVDQGQKADSSTVLIGESESGENDNLRGIKDWVQGYWYYGKVWISFMTNEEA